MLESCSGDGDDPMNRERMAADFRAITWFTQGGDGCGVRCSASILVEAPDRLSLEDESGVERIELSSQEYDSVIEIVAGVEFLDGLSDAGLAACEPGHAGGVHGHFELKWENEDAISVRPGECSNDEGHPFGRLRRKLDELALKYLSCPAPPYPMWNPQPGQKPPLRYLCYMYEFRVR